MPDQDYLIYDQPGHLIRRLQQIAVALFMAETKEFDITPIQYAALLAVRLHPGGILKDARDILIRSSRE